MNVKRVFVLAMTLGLYVSSFPTVVADPVVHCTLAQALELPDDSSVQLTGLLVDKVVFSPPYAVVRDAANKADRLERLENARDVNRLPRAVLTMQRIEKHVMQPCRGSSISGSSGTSGLQAVRTR